VTELQELKRLLVGEETDAVRKLASRLDRLEDREHRLQNVVESLPEAILASDDRLSQALGKPVRDSFRESLSRDPKQYAEILYPIMAPAIRLSIAQAMRDVVRSINQTVDSTFSAQGLKWRLESIRTRTPYSQIVLQNSFRYRVEEILLIHKVTGLLIDRVVVDPDGGQDGDAVGAMLAALEDFVRDSFSHESDDEGNNLREVDVGGRTVWLSHSPTVTMATVIFGHPPESLRPRLEAQLESLHAEYGTALRDFDGGQPIAGVQSELIHSIDTLAAVEPSEVEAEVRRPNPLASVIKVVAGVAVISFLLFWLFRSIEERNALESTRRILDDTPGIVVTDLSRRDDRIHVTGLADPLADIDETSLANIGVEMSEVDLELEPYQSLDGPIVIKRAQRQMEVPETVEVWLSEDDDTLNLRGEADYGWLLDAIERSNHVAGIGGVNFDAISPRAKSVQTYIREVSEAPESIDFFYVARVVRAEGEAPLAWLDGIRNVSFSDKWIRKTDWSSVTALELVRVQELSKELDAEHLFVEANSGESILSLEQSIVELSEKVKELLRNCAELQTTCVLNLYVTSAVGDGDVEFEAGQEVARMLRQQGIPLSALDVQPGGFYKLDPAVAEMVVSFRVDKDEK